MALRRLTGKGFDAVDGLVEDRPLVGFVAFRRRRLMAIAVVADFMTGGRDSFADPGIGVDRVAGDEPCARQVVLSEDVDEPVGPDLAELAMGDEVGGLR